MSKKRMLCQNDDMQIEKKSRFFSKNKPSDPLYEALKQSSPSLDTITLLFEEGILVKNEFLFNSLDRALKSNASFEIIQLLFKNGAKVINGVYFNTIDRALLSKANENVMELLFKNGAKINSRYPLLTAFREYKTDMKVADLLLKNGSQQYLDSELLKEALLSKARFSMIRQFVETGITPRREDFIQAFKSSADARTILYLIMHAARGEFKEFGDLSHFKEWSLLNRFVNYINFNEKSYKKIQKDIVSAENDELYLLQSKTAKQWLTQWFMIYKVLKKNEFGMYAINKYLPKPLWKHIGFLVCREEKFSLEALAEHFINKDDRFLKTERDYLLKSINTLEGSFNSLIADVDNGSNVPSKQSAEQSIILQRSPHIQENDPLKYTFFYTTTKNKRGMEYTDQASIRPV